MSDPLRIAVFVGTFPVLSETFILRQIKGMIEAGHEVDIYADTRGTTDGPLHAEIHELRLMDKVTFIDASPEAVPWELPIWPVTGRTWTPGASKPVLNSVRLARAMPHAFRCIASQPRLTKCVLSRSEYGFQADSLSALFRLSSLARRRCRYDVLHAHFGPIGNSFRFARELWQAPFLVSFHGYDFCTLPRQQGRDMYRRLFPSVDLVTVNSDFTRDRVLELGCSAEKIRTLPMGLNLEEFPFRERTRPPEEPVRILTVARLVEIKGYEFVLRALARLQERGFKLAYDIVGDGPLRQALQTLSTQLGLDDVATFHGGRDGVYVRRLMAAAHIGLLASVNVHGDAEGQGLFLQEAQACGLPVIATNHGALAEGIVPDRSGYLVSERNVEGLADRLEFLVRDSESWPEMGRAGRKFVEQRYDIRRLNQQLEGIYREAKEKFEPAECATS